MTDYFEKKNGTIVPARKPADAVNLRADGARKLGDDGEERYRQQLENVAGAKVNEPTDDGASDEEPSKTDEPKGQLETTTVNVEPVVEPVAPRPGPRVRDAK